MNQLKNLKESLAHAYDCLTKKAETNPEPETKPEPEPKVAPKSKAYAQPYPGFNFNDYLKEVYDELQEIYLREQYLIKQSILRAESGNQRAQNRCELFGYEYNKTFIMLPKKESTIKINCYQEPYIRTGEFIIP